MLGLATALLLLLPEVVLPRPADVTAAAGDAVELERLASRLGPARLLTLLEDAAGRRQPRLTMAVLRSIGLWGAAHPDLSLQFLAPFALTLRRLTLGHALDEKGLLAAGDALLQTGKALGRQTTCDESATSSLAECGPVLFEAADRLYQLGADFTLPVALREAALLALATLPAKSFLHLAMHLRKLAQTADLNSESATDSAAPSPSRAALAALAALFQDGQPSPLVDLVRTAEPPLASGAAAELCAVLVPKKGPHAPPVADEDVQAKIRALAGPEHPLLVRQRLLDCLRIFGTPADRALFQGIVSAGRKKGK